MCFENGSFDMFGAHVSRILGSWYVLQREGAALQFILDPEVAHIQMANATKASTSHDAYGRGGIGENLQSDGVAEVFRHALEAQGLCCTTDNPYEFGFSR